MRAKKGAAPKQLFCDREALAFTPGRAERAKTSPFSWIDGSSAIVKSPDSYFFIQKTFVIDEVGKQLESIMSQKS